MRTGKSTSVGSGWSRRCATFCSAGTARALRKPALSLSMACTIAACARAMPINSSASCCDERICIASPSVVRSAMVASGRVFAWKRPDNLGVRDGRLAPCKRSPNCVSSQADASDREHYIAPIRGGIDAARDVIASMPRTTIVEERQNYLYAEFRTRLLRYVDDVEFYFDGQVLQVRSCSRLGRRDFGVNRKRLEALRALIE